jgi:hypothetical protein
MSSHVIMSPEEMILTFKQGSEESFKEAWSRINNSHNETEPKMTLGLLLSSFYFGLNLRYRYALNTVAGGDFLQCDGDQAFNAIKKLIMSSSSSNKCSTSIGNIHTRLNTLESRISFLKDGYNKIREKLDCVPINSEPSLWLPTLKVTIGN